MWNSTNKMVRCEDAMKKVCDRLNGTPRKCLGWRTPLEAFREEMRNLG